jgi:hypothetical protein
MTSFTTHCWIGERASVGWLLYRDAAVADADVAGWLENQRLRRVTYGRLITRLPLEALTPSRITRRGWRTRSRRLCCTRRRSKVDHLTAHATAIAGGFG